MKLVIDIPEAQYEDMKVIVTNTHGQAHGIV